MHISKVLRVFTCTYVETLWKFRVAATGQCPAIANFQGNFRNFTFSGARKFPVAFLEIYVWPKPWRAALVLRSVRTRGDPLACARPRRDWRNEEVLEFGSMSEEEKTEVYIPGIFREVSGVYNAGK